MKTILIALAALIAAGPALAQEAAKTAAPTPSPEKKVCRTVMETGSMFGKRTCRTKAEWAAIDEANSAAAQGVRDRAHGGMPR